MPRTNKIIIRSGTAAPTASDFVTGEPAWDKTNNKFYIKNTAGTMVEIGAGGATEIYEYATTASFPATGGAATLYIATDYGRVYRWVDSTTKYVEVGAVSSYDSRWDLFLPGAPTSVAGTAGNGQITLTWTAPTVNVQTAITDYSIQYSTNSGSSWTAWSHSASASTTAVIGSLTNGVSYVFRVAGINGVGQGAWSSTSASVKPSTDPYISGVSLLIHADGTGSAFTDSSATPKTITVGGSATQSTAQSKFGGKSAKLANGDYLSVISSTVLTEANNYVLEFWIYPLSQTENDRFFVIENSNGDSRGFIRSANNSFQWNTFGVPAYPLTGNLTNNQWQHVALVKSGSTTSLYIDGTRTSTTTSTLFPTNPTRINWGASINNYEYAAVNAYYDDIRITLNTDRGYTGTTITVPTAAFPDP